MSDFQSRQLAADLLQQTLAKKRTPSMWHLWLGVIYPAAVVAFELATRWCAQSFFDPMPTVWHALAVAAVPAINLAIWLALRERYSLAPKWLAGIGGVAIGIAAFYALVFLPLMPLAVVGVLIYGLGLLPMAPLVSFLSAVRLTRVLRARHEGLSFGRPIAGGIAAGLALLVALDIPAAATRLGVQWAASSGGAERERGIALLRKLGDEDLLLRLCYDSTGRPSGLLSALVMFGAGGLLDPEQRITSQSTAEVREIFYRVTGEPFNARPAPFQTGTWARFSDFQWDGDHGGTTVGGRIKGLDLVSSRMDGSISAKDAAAYLEWVVEFRNTSPMDREARVQIALPPGGVVSRATLWVDGEEREAAYGGRGAVRAAYERVAVQQRCDPLLVTTKGADRVLAQAFPVPRDGGTIKFKLGITAPLDIEETGKGRLVLPAIVDRNFSIGEASRHSLWLESETALAAEIPGLTATAIKPDLFRLQGSLGDADLARTRPVVTAARSPAAEPVLARIGMGAEVIQEIVSAPAHPPGALLIVIDGSARVAPAANALSGVLDRIPSGIPVGFTIAAEPVARLAIAPWSDAHRQAVVRLLSSVSFAGGQDNTRAIADALVELERYEAAALLWVHGPQPIVFRDTSGLLEQAASRLTRRPEVALYAVEPGPNELLPDLPWAWGARSIPVTGETAADLGGWLERTLAPGERLAVKRSEAPARLASEGPLGQVKGSGHVARLWAADRVLAMMLENPEGNRKAAVDLATEYRLVTPVSGAVVLETARQYEEAGLKPVAQGTVPTVPEPHEWALIILSALGFLWLMRRRPAGMAAA